ncbi:MAG: SGNH/GDSL hydrolase family protein [Gammaproteobacteria bacterium]|nr:SGNH/GDSL hydrolase family protein [Gammaproteobacteria bacterium]
MVLLILLEASVRVLELAPPLTNRYGNMVPDPYLPFMPRPNSKISGRSKYDEFDYHVEINSVGLRDFERPYEKPAGVYRILGLGDSTTYGGAAFFEDSYLRLVERMLNERVGDHPGIEVIKAGIPRYYPEPERILLEHYGVLYEPDLITVGFGSSDVVDTLQGLSAITIHEAGNSESGEVPEIGRIGMLLYKHSHLTRMALNRYIKYTITRPTNWDEIYKSEGMYEKQWLEIEAEFSKITKIANTIGARLVILYIPDFTLFKRGKERHYPAQRLRTWAAQNDVTFVDVTPAMLAANETTTTPLYWARDRHHTPAGYKVIADTLYNALIANDLVP